MITLMYLLGSHSFTTPCHSLLLQYTLCTVSSCKQPYSPSLSDTLLNHVPGVMSISGQPTAIKKEQFNMSQFEGED